MAPGFDEGLTDFLALEYLRREGPESFQRSLNSRLRYLSSAVDEHGDRAILETMRALESGESVPEIHAFYYTKPALVWNMFRRLFGQEDTYDILARVNESFAGRNWRAECSSVDEYVSKWYGELRDIVEDEAGPEAALFLDAWYKETHPLDLAVSATAQQDEAGDWVLVVALEDEHRPGDLPARELLPLVDLSITTRAGEETATHTEEVTLTGTRTEVEFSYPDKPVSVSLAPWVLDYDLADNHAGLEAPADRLTPVAIVAGLALAAAVGLFLYRRLPGRQKPPPMAGRAQ